MNRGPTALKTLNKCVDLEHGVWFQQSRCRSPRRSSDYPRILLALVLDEFDSHHHGEILNYLEKC